MLARDIQDKSGLVCQIQGTYSTSSEPGWMSGDHEGDTVVVLSAFDTNNDRFSSRARIKFIGKSTPAQAPEIPVRYLQPVHPEHVGEDVVFLYGDHQGNGAKVKEISESHATVALTGTQLIVEASPKQLCKRSSAALND